jgi:protein-tyrosine-phosphatase
VLRILFVCSDNASTSLMAEAFANMLGHDGVEAYSAGAAPATAVDARTVSMMQELGYDLPAHHCTALDELPDVEFEYLVTLGGPFDCPLTKARLQIDWDIPDPTGMGDSEFRTIRDTIRARVTRLLTAPRVPSD